ncbi:Uncharacterised protein [Chlamydia trachomatis]|nr:Uncharacterised protein [Chlamydia trachomatis]
MGGSTQGAWRSTDQSACREGRKPGNGARRCRDARLESDDLGFEAVDGCELRASPGLGDAPRPYSEREHRRRGTQPVHSRLGMGAGKGTRCYRPR